MEKMKSKEINFLNEKEGQIKFFEKLEISPVIQIIANFSSSSDLMFAVSSET